jgi:hypothetical protein
LLLCGAHLRTVLVLEAFAHPKRSAAQPTRPCRGILVGRSGPYTKGATARC